MNILFLCDYLHPKYGYQEFHLAYELSKLSKENKITIITSNRYFPFKTYQNHEHVLGRRIHNKISEKFDDLNVLYYKPLLEFKTRVIPNFRFFYLLLRSKYDVCFSHSSSSFVSLFLLITSRILPFRLIVDNHMHFVAHRNTLSTKIYYFFLKIVNQYIVSHKTIYLGVTRESCKFLELIESVKSKQIQLLPIGYSSTFFQVPKNIKEFITIRKEVRHKLGIDFNSILITQTGKISSDKRPDLTIKATKYELKNNVGHILFIGPHSDEEKLKLYKIFKEINNPNWNLHFFENVEFNKLNKFFIASDLLSFPGGASLSCIEGASSGCSSVVAHTPEGKIRSKIGIVKVPQNNSDESFLETLHLSIKEIDYRSRDINKIFKKSLDMSKLVAEFSYKSVGELLIKIIKNNLE